MNRLAIFDCDGTLVDSQINICLAMEDCFAQPGSNRPTARATRRVVGLSLVEAMREMLPEADADLHDVARRGLQARVPARCAPTASSRSRSTTACAELIERARRRRLAARRRHRQVRPRPRSVPRASRHRGRFVTLQTADRHPSKPHPSMIEQALAEAGASAETSLMIGDTSYDMAMAQAAGVRGDRRRLGLSRSSGTARRGRGLCRRPPRRRARFRKGLRMNPNLPPSGDDKVARNRFILLNLVRIGGTASCCSAWSPGRATWSARAARP